MPYSAKLEKRLDAVSLKFSSLDKKKMFGGIGYLLNGTMAFGVHKDFLIIRVDPAMGKELLKEQFIGTFDMTARPMAGWVQVSPEGVVNEGKLLRLVKLALDYTKTLPKK